MYIFLSLKIISFFYEAVVKSLSSILTL